MERLAMVSVGVGIAGLMAAQGGWLDVSFVRLTQLVVASAVLAFAMHAGLGRRR